MIFCINIEDGNSSASILKIQSQSSNKWYPKFLNDAKSLSKLLYITRNDSLFGTRNWLHNESTSGVTFSSSSKIPIQSFLSILVRSNIKSFYNSSYSLHAVIKYPIFILYSNLEMIDFY